MNQLTQRLQGLAGLAAIVAFVVGVPTVLLVARTTPWTTDWGMVGQRLTMADNGTLLIIFLGTIAWIGWAYFTVTLVAEAVARIRGLRVPSLRGFAVSQTAARRLFDVAALAFDAAVTRRGVGVVVVVAVVFAAEFRQVPDVGVSACAPGRDVVVLGLVRR